MAHCNAHKRHTVLHDPLVIARALIITVMVEMVEMGALSRKLKPVWA